MSKTSNVNFNLPDIHPIIEPFFDVLTEFGTIATSDEVNIGEFRSRKPILVDSVGRIMDDSKMAFACSDLEIVPEFEIYKGVQNIVAMLEAILSRNAHFMKINRTSLSMIAAGLINLDELYPEEHLGGISIEEAASILRVGEDSIEQANHVYSYGCDLLFDTAMMGEIPVPVATAVAHLPESEQNVITEHMWKVTLKCGGDNP